MATTEAPPLSLSVALSHFPLSAHHKVDLQAEAEAEAEADGGRNSEALADGEPESASHGTGEAKAKSKAKEGGAQSPAAHFHHQSHDPAYTSPSPLLRGPHPICR